MCIMTQQCFQEIGERVGEQRNDGTCVRPAYARNCETNERNKDIFTALINEKSLPSFKTRNFNLS